MAIDEPLDAFLSRTAPGDYRAGDLGPGDSGRFSVESFVAASTGSSREIASRGDLRLHGDGVVGSAADLADVGQIATTWQKLVSAVGAALEHIKTIRGQLPTEIANRTALLLSAAPAPGSVILRVIPKVEPVSEIAPGGTLPMVAASRPLADRASETLLGLLGDVTTVGPSTLESLSATMLELGPRVGSSLVSLATVLDRSNVTLDASWREPEQPTRRAQITPSGARWIRAFVSGRDLDAEEETVTGTLRTISDAESWLVEVQGKSRRMDASDLSPSVVSTLHVGQHVQLHVLTALREQPDGNTRTTRRILAVAGTAESPAAEASP